MRKKVKVTFRRHKREAWYTPMVDIKHQGGVVGFISPPTRGFGSKKWEVWFHVKVPEENCEWRNVKLAGGFDSEDEARSHAKMSADLMDQKYGLYYHEPEED